MDSRDHSPSTTAATPKSAAPHAGCTNPDCGDYPYYGVAPHQCFYKRGAEFTIGQSIGLPASEWPDNFVVDLEPGETAETVAYPSACGVYYCPNCRAGLAPTTPQPRDVSVVGDSSRAGLEHHPLATGKEDQ